MNEILFSLLCDAGGQVHKGKPSRNGFLELNAWLKLSM